MNYLVFFRMQRGLTQKQLAKLLNVDSTVLCRIERGWLARVPNSVDEAFKRIFGKEWSFERLMKPVPDITTLESLERSRRQAQVG